MTIEDLKKLPQSEQKSLYSSFWMAWSASVDNDEGQRKYWGILRQLKEIFELDQLTWMQWHADATARELEVSLALKDFVEKAA